MTELRLVPKQASKKPYICESYDRIHLHPQLVFDFKRASLSRTLSLVSFAEESLAIVDQLPASQVKSWQHAETPFVLVGNGLDLDLHPNVQELARQTNTTACNVAISALAYNLWRRRQITSVSVDNVIAFSDYRK